jgi:hypothetical protein
MPQLPTWKPPVGAVVEAVQSRGTQMRDTAADAIERGRQARDSITGRIADFADTARAHGEQLPRSIYDEVRRRVNWLDLATKEDVETHSRLGRRRVSLALNEFLAAQHEHERELLETLRAEIRSELESLASALNDDAFDEDVFFDDDDVYDDELGFDDLVVAADRSTRNARDELDYDDDDDDDIDLTGDEYALRTSLPDRSEW